MRTLTRPRGTVRAAGARILPDLISRLVDGHGSRLQLDWVEQFCRSEIEPLDLVFPGAAYSRAFDMRCERALSRQSHGKVIADHQMVQEAIADSYADLNMLRLLVLWTAWTIDNSSTLAAWAGHAARPAARGR